MSDLVDFLRARLDEDEQKAAEAERLVDRDAWFDILEQALGDGREATKRAATTHFLEFRPLRILREVEAKRRLLDEYAQYAENDTDKRYEYADGWANGLGFAVRLLALPYAAHADYRAEWAA